MDGQKTISELQAEYREAAERSGDLSDPKQQNKWVDKLHACYKLLRKTAEGRGAIMALMADPDLNIREWAAAHSLQWDPDTARPVLEAIQEMEVFPISLNAEMTLKEFDNGRLTFDY